MAYKSKTKTAYSHTKHSESLVSLQKTTQNRAFGQVIRPPTSEVCIYVPFYSYRYRFTLINMNRLLEKQNFG